MEVCSGIERSTVFKYQGTRVDKSLISSSLSLLVLSALCATPEGAKEVRCAFYKLAKQQPARAITDRMATSYCRCTPWLTEKEPVQGDGAGLPD